MNLAINAAIFKGCSALHQTILSWNLSTRFFFEKVSLKLSMNLAVNAAIFKGCSALHP